MRSPLAALVLLGIIAQTGAALAGPAAVPLAATYQAQVPATMGAAADASVSVTVTNTGDETWELWGPPLNVVGKGQVALAYHWYDAAGAVAVWDGLRSSLGAGGTQVRPQQSVSAMARIRAPERTGAYTLRLALVKEGVEWLAPSQPFAVQVNAAYGAKITAPAVQPLVTATTYTIPVTVQNTGASAWNAGGANPISLSSHWHDGAGTTVVWDGPRSALAADVAPGATTMVSARITTPARPGSYTLTFDLVREGVAWFAALGSAPAKVSVSVAPVTYAARYGVSVSAASYIGETKTLPVTITNSGNVPWNAENPVNLASHLYDARGNVVVWDGQRALLGDVAVGATKQVQLAYTSPGTIGDYTLAIDAVREGVAWFSGLGTPAVRLPMRVDSGYGVGYGATTTPALATIGARVPLRVEVNNYGPRALVAAGANPVRLSYHLYDSAGGVVSWDGLRGTLPGDIPAGASASVDIEVQLPSSVGTYTLAWDLVQEGVAWFSQLGLATKRESVQVQPGVTFYGKGFGHGLGMSQYGAQGMATGAGGRPALSGEQIVAQYYPGTTLADLRAVDPGNTMIRVLLSQPSSQGRYSCGAAYFDGTIANLSSAGGLRVLNEGAGNAEVFRASPSVSVQVHATAGVVRVWNQATATPTRVYEGAGPVVVVPLDPTKPIDFLEKGSYRGNFRFTNLGGTLRVLNVVTYDEYAKGVVPLEMLKNWHLEAYKAQAIAARTYAHNSYKGGASDYDVLEDQSDQCYGGVQMRSGRVVESDVTNRAVDLTAGKILTYQGRSIRAYFSSSNGGYSKSLGCWMNNVRVVNGGPDQCGDSPPYLTAVADPWDLAVTTPAPNRNASWQATFTSAQIRDAVLNYRGIDIGTLLSVDLSNRQPAGVGHVTTVLVVGTTGTYELNADRLLRDYLFLRSTMVRLAPW